MIEKMPIVIPNKERNVLNLLIVTELMANIIASLMSLKNIINSDRIGLRTKDKKNQSLESEKVLNCNNANNDNY
jgi:hypothetical protein